MRHLEQTPEVLQNDLLHLGRVRLRAKQNKNRDGKRNEQLIESLSAAIAILETDAFGSPHKNGSSKTNGVGKSRAARRA